MIQRILAALGIIAMGVTSAFAGDPFKCKTSAQDCLEMMSAKLKSSGWVGIEFETPDYKVTKVVPSSPAEKAGLQVGDVLYALNGVKLRDENKEELAKVRKEWKPGQSVTYSVRRAGADREVTLTLAPMPADIMAAWIGQHMREHAESERADVTTK